MKRSAHLNRSGDSPPASSAADPTVTCDGGTDTFHSEIDMEIINHLLFHRALGDGAFQIDKYIEILRGINEGEHIIMEDPRDRTTALVFELVLQEDFNPWDIDLKRFATSYVRRITGDLDFITAGRLISMAFRVLKLQSNELLFSLTEPVEDDFDDIMGIEDWMEEDESYLYTRRVVEMRDPPIEETVTHRGNRPVTLFELVEAFGEAATESEKMREHNLRMQTERNRIAHLRRRNRARAGGQVHDEDYQEDIRLIGILLGGFGRKRVLFSEILPHSPIDPVTTFISLLFLNFEERIIIEQKDFPRGDITITIGEGEGSVTVQNALDSPLRMASEA